MKQIVAVLIGLLLSCGMVMAQVDGTLTYDPGTSGKVGMPFPLKLPSIDPIVSTITQIPIGTSSNTVNGLCVLPGTTGNPARLSSCGVDANSVLLIEASGSGQVHIGNVANGYSVVVPNAVTTTQIQLAGATTNPIISCLGSTPCGLIFSGLGAGVLQIGSGAETIKLGSSGMFTADASTVACVGALGPVGIHATVQKWLTITDNGGTVGYIPVC